MPQNTILQPALATPVNTAFSTATTGGTLAAATYAYRVSALDGRGGETLASTETTQATTGTTSTVTVNWGAVTGATGYRIYGRTSGGQQLLATVGAVTTYTDTGAATPSGALPTANTTGLGAGTSTDITIASGSSVTVGLFASSGGVPPQDYATVMQDTPGGDNVLCNLTGVRPSVVLSGPGTFRVVKPVTSVAVGVFSET